jgi:hypothetical protein
VIALWWYLCYFPDLQFVFGPEGIISHQAIERWREQSPPAFSIFDWSQTAGALWFTYFAGLLVLVLFAAGLFSRLTSVAAFLVVVSLIHRGPMLARPMEDVLAMAMLYLCFGPTGAAFSLDRLRKKQSVAAKEEKLPPAPSVGANIALRLIQVHLALLHFGMAIGQLRDDSWWMGRAIWGYISKPDSGYIDMTWLADHIFLLNLWTHGIVVFEFAFALLIWNRLARPILFVATVIVWGSVGLIGGMLDFTAVMLGATLAFLPAEWLNRRS